MRKAALLSIASLLTVLGLYVFLIKKHDNLRPAFYAKVVAKKVESAFETDTVNWQGFGIQLTPKRSDYSLSCQLAKANRKTPASMEVSEIGKRFEVSLMDEIIPHWYGTAWSFDGHTDVPKQGEIACGYFVSTTLQHVGVNVNRYQLAQQWPENEAKSLALGGEVIEVTGNNSTENIAQMKSKIGEGICFVGLGRSHVGYLLKRKNELFFLHSSYFTPGTVIIELASKSPVFCAYDEYFIVELSNNEAFLKRWLNNQKIEVIKDK